MRRPVSPTPSVTLAPLRPKHAPAIVRWLADPFISTNLGLSARPTLAKTRAFISEATDGVTSCARAILLASRHVGTVVLDRIDRRVGRARLHIYVGDAGARGRGVAKRALELVLALAFEELGLEKVWLTVHARNAPARRVYEAAGFVVEGTHRAEFLLDGQRVDEIYMGILRSEYAARRVQAVTSAR